MKKIYSNVTFFILLILAADSLSEVSIGYKSNILLGLKNHLIEYNYLHQFSITFDSIVTPKIYISPSYGFISEFNYNNENGIDLNEKILYSTKMFLSIQEIGIAMGYTVVSFGKNVINVEVQPSYINFRMDAISSVSGSQNESSSNWIEKYQFGKIGILSRVGLTSKQTERMITGFYLGYYYVSAHYYKEYYKINKYEIIDENTPEIIPKTYYNKELAETRDMRVLLSRFLVTFTINFIL